MILNYLLPSSLVYKLIKPDYDIKCTYINKLNNEEIVEKRDIKKDEIMFIDQKIHFGGSMLESSIFVYRKSIDEDNLRYMDVINDYITNNSDKKLELQGFSNGCNDLIMFLEFLQEHKNDTRSKHHKKAKDILEKISNIELQSPYQNIATSVPHFLTNAWNNLGMTGKLLTIFTVLLSPVLLPIIAIAGIVSKIIDVNRGFYNSKVLSDEHLYHRFGKFLQQNPNITGSIKYSINDPMVGDFGITEKDQKDNYKIKDEFKKYNNIKISVSEEKNHYTKRDDCKTIGSSQMSNIKLVSQKEINNSIPFEANVSYIKEKNNEDEEDSIINNLLNYISPYNNTIYNSCDNRNFSERTETSYYTCKNGNSSNDKTFINALVGL
jgi:hypothetical protein